MARSGGDQQGVVGVDVGGTFTDFLLAGPDGVRIHKRPSTSDDPARGVLAGLQEMGVDAVEVVHGSTVATNALLERRGAKTALLTTRGFGDVLLIGRQARPAIYDLHPRRPPPLVPDDLRVELEERVSALGESEHDPSMEEIEQALDRVQSAGAESLAICFLFSFLQAEHERLAAERARARGLFVSASHEVLPEYREYERTSTTAVNAYVSPMMARYLSRLEDGLHAVGARHLRVMASDGGSISATAAGRLAVRTVLSGPAGGVAGAFTVARSAGFPDVITFDMGGTSTDVALCPGRILTRDETEIGGLAVRTALVDVHTVGAGGGSIARLDAGGALRVGPESAGADPGPACYGRGDLPAVSDAHAVLGRLRPDRFLGGRMMLHLERAHTAITPLAGAFGTVEATAEAVLRVANASMERAVRVVSVERGYDPRGFTLLAFGGAGPLHGCDLAAALGIPRVLVPRYPGVLSALGMVAAPVTREGRIPLLRAVKGDGPDAEMARTVDAEVATLQRGLRADGYDARGMTTEVTVAMRYQGQSYELPVEIAGYARGRGGAAALGGERLRRLFHEAHGRRYGHADPARPVEAVSLRVRAVLPGPPLSLTPTFEEGEARSGSATVHFDRPRRTTLWDRERMRPGLTVPGPALVTQLDCTTVIPPGWRATVDEGANLIMEMR